MTTLIGRQSRRQAPAAPTSRAEVADTRPDVRQHTDATGTSLLPVVAGWDLAAGRGGDGGRPGRRKRDRGDLELRTFVAVTIHTPRAGRLGPLPRWRTLSLARRRLRSLAPLASNALTASLATTERDDGELDTIPRRCRWGQWGTMWGPIGANVPAHRTSTARIGVLNPLVAAANQLAGGPVVGINNRAREAFTFDPWLATKADLVKAPHMIVCGLMNNGKSMALKILAVRLISVGRQVIVTSDIKGEWSKIAEKIHGGQIIKVGPGTGTVLNPLDVGNQPDQMTDEQWTQVVAARRLGILRVLLAILRDGGKPEQRQVDKENKALSLLVDAMGTGGIEATIPGLVGSLASAPTWLVEATNAAAVDALWTVFSNLTEGALAGMFDGPSNVTIDPGAPMVVIDNSALLAHEDKTLVAACRAVTTNWVKTVLTAGDKRFRFLIAEECWEELQYKEMVDVYDEIMRLYGVMHAAVAFVFHDPKDITLFGEKGSEHRNKVEALMRKSETAVLFQQSPAGLNELPNLVPVLGKNDSIIDKLTGLPRGIGIWCIGEKQPPIPVHAEASATGYAVFNTDEGRN